MPPHPAAIAHLWTAAHAMFARMRAAIGETAGLITRALNDDERRAIRAWLRPLEIMARKIALIEALALIARGETRVAGPKPAAASNPPSHQPALIAIPIPPQARIVTPAAAAPAPANQRAPALRLWPRARASAGPRVRLLGLNRLVAVNQREQTRAAFARRMRAAARRPDGERLARRIDALARVLDKPERAASRFARALTRRPDLAVKLALAPAPRTRLYAEPEYELADTGARTVFYEWRMSPPRDTS